jgi:hypothetical protein
MRQGVITAPPAARLDERRGAPKAESARAAAALTLLLRLHPQQLTNMR